EIEGVTDEGNGHYLAHRQMMADIIAPQQFETGINKIAGQGGSNTQQQCDMAEGCDGAGDISPIKIFEQMKQQPGHQQQKCHCQQPHSPAQPSLACCRAVAICLRICVIRLLHPVGSSLMRLFLMRLFLPTITAIQAVLYSTRHWFSTTLPFW